MKMLKLKSILILFIAVTLIISCGQGENDNSRTASPENTPPTADAGPDQNVLTGSLVTLDGSASSDADLDPLTFNWSVTNVPGGSTIITSSLSDPKVVNPTFTPDVDGLYVLSLVVNDGLVNSTADTITITTDSAICKEDTTFGADGMVVFPGGFRNAVAYDSALQSDGKILVTGYSETIDTGEDVLLARFNTDGSLDTSFGTDGVVLWAGDTGRDIGYKLAIQSDGKILVTGETMRLDGNSQQPEVILLRFDIDGTLDTSFGINGVSSWDSGAWDGGYDIALQPDGKILVVGASNGEILLLRFDANGMLDTSFAANGVVLKVLGDYSDGMSLALQQDGKILVTGYSYNGTDYDIILIRFNINGSLDTTFGTDGVVTWDSGSWDTPYDLLLQADGKILLTGEANGDTTLLRFNSDGSLDTSFGTGGSAHWDNNGSWDAGFSLVQSADARTIVSGVTNNGSDFDMLVVGFNADGSLDPSFGNNSAVIWDGGYGDDMGYNAILDKEGKVIVTGYCNNGTDFDIMLMKMN